MTDGKKELIKLQAAELSRRATAAYAAVGVGIPISLLNPALQGAHLVFTVAFGLVILGMGNHCRKASEDKIMELDGCAGDASSQPTGSPT